MKAFIVSVIVACLLLACLVVSFPRRPKADSLEPTNNGVITTFDKLQTNQLQEDMSIKQTKKMPPIVTTEPDDCDPATWQVGKVFPLHCFPASFTTMD